jgi:V/A-type H+-transporting ATPase subunit I
MFRTVPMMQLQVLVLAQDERVVLNGLGHLGAVHLTHSHPGPDTAPLAPVDYTAELARCDRLRARVQEFRQLLEIPQLNGESMPREVFTINQAEESLLNLQKRSNDLLARRQHIIQRQKELSSLCERISCFRGFDIPLDGLDQFSFLHFVTGSLPVQKLESLGREVRENMVFLPLAKQKGQQSLLAITTSQDWPILEKILHQSGFQRELLPVVEGATVDRVSEEGEKEQEQLAAELKQLDGKIKTIAAELVLPLAEIERFVDTEHRLLSAIQRFPRTEAAVFISGWIPAGEVTALEKHLGEITGGRYVLQATPPDASIMGQAPVLLQHSRLLRPFEVLISTYGLPDYHELEPTLFVALSYVVMFGMMFGDAGHGMVLAVAGLAALIAGRSKRLKDFGVLLLFGGLSSTIFGVVYGSYFGIEALKKYALWHDPLEGNPMQLMYGAIGIGVIMISLGLILNIINRFRRGDVIGGVLDKFGLVGLLFYWGTLALLMYGATIQSWGLTSASVILFLVVPIVGWSLKEPLEHFIRNRNAGLKEANDGLASAIMESCVGAFEAILSYLANTISFVRLAAYAMSHAALLFAAFMVSVEVRDVPFVGSAFSLLVIIFGNIIAIVLEGIIASVQAVRLEYYEFFSKFFSGSGQPFVPFRLVAGDKDSGP